MAEARAAARAPADSELEACCPSILAAPLDEAEAAELAHGFAALADPARLRLFSLIAAQPEGEVCACALVEPLGRSQPTVSHHLKVLYDAGLVGKERRGTWVWYWVAPGRLEALRAALAPGDSAQVGGIAPSTRATSLLGATNR
ncbi:MAG: metalloregulator ArsR/SmtB family transcription factor [Actinomycetota bacterium]